MNAADTAGPAPSGPGAGAAPSRPSATSAAIEVAGLTKRFGPTVAVQNLSFAVSYGRITGFLGPNGAGKTTTLRTMLGLVRPDAGTTAIAGRAYADLADPARTVGALLDAAAVHPGRTGRDHLRVSARAAGIPDSRADELLAMVGLAQAARQRAGGYSLGMRQRLGLAATLLGNPRVLVLDEPANGLDPQGIRWLRDLLRSLAADGRAVLVSSHVLAEVAQTVDDVIMISRGSSVLQAPLEQIMAGQVAGVRAAGPDAQLLGRLLSAEGARVVPGGQTGIVISDRTIADIGRVIVARRLAITELSAAGPSLEDIYLGLTATPDGEPS
ncbi:MAG: ABC transporter ATP-binding protein [Streptosporangiaceae bacterium]